jgi:hypothetical protein
MLIALLCGVAMADTTKQVRTLSCIDSFKYISAQRTSKRLRKDVSGSVTWRRGDGVRQVSSRVHVSQT